MYSNVVSRNERLEALLYIDQNSRAAQVSEDLADLRSAKKMLLGRCEQRRQRRLLVNEQAGEAVVEEALVAERIAVSIDN